MIMWRPSVSTAAVWRRGHWNRGAKRFFILMTSFDGEGGFALSIIFCKLLHNSFGVDIISITKVLGGVYDG